MGMQSLRRSPTPVLFERSPLALPWSPDVLLTSRFHWVPTSQPAHLHRWSQPRRSWACCRRMCQTSPPYSRLACLAARRQVQRRRQQRRHHQPWLRLPSLVSTAAWTRGCSRTHRAPLQSPGWSSRRSGFLDRHTCSPCRTPSPTARSPRATWPCCPAAAPPRRACSPGRAAGSWPGPSSTRGRSSRPWAGTHSTRRPCPTPPSLPSASPAECQPCPPGGTARAPLPALGRRRLVWWGTCRLGGR
mmetsp:Transcript_67413/g.190008  ORF Transcript_67413/g.190008 Transcript_67413/m.190008 type:complete len:245 (-) Transcript_67413:47-781(-)